MVLVLLMIPAALLDKHRERHAPAYFLIGTILTIAAEVLYVVEQQAEEPEPVTERQGEIVEAPDPALK